MRNNQIATLKLGNDITKNENSVDMFKSSYKTWWKGPT